MEQFPGNSNAKPEPPEPKKIERVTSGEAKIRKKPFLRRMTETFIGGTPRNAAEYMVLNVLVPSARDMLSDAISQGFERLIYGDSRYTGAARRSSAATGHISYNRMSQPNKPAFMQQRQVSRRARANHEFGEIVLQSRSEAEQVIDQMFELLSKYDQVTVADLYDLVGVGGTHTDHKWGWTDLRGANVARVRNGFLLDLPEPDPVD